MGHQAGILYLRNRDLVDDTDEFLRDAGYAVTSVTTTEAALDHLRSAETDCVVTNYEVPDCDGVEFMGALSAIETITDEYPDVPVILYSPVESHDLVTEALERDVFDYVPKRPGTESNRRLLRRIESAITRRETRRRARSQTRINRVSREVNEALIRTSTPEEVARALTETVAASERYVAAAVVDEQLSVVAAATGREGDATERGLAYRDPLAEAVDADATTVVSLADRDPDDSEGFEHGSETVAVAPLSYRGTGYGVLAVYTDRPGAFDDGERGTIGDLARNAALARRNIETRDALADRTEQLERRTRQLEQFARLISHEIRHPLQTAVGNAELARREGDPEYFDAVEESHGEIEHLVSDLVTLVQSGERFQDRSAVELSTAVRDAAAELGADDAVDIAVDATVEADPEQLVTLLSRYFETVLAADPDAAIRVEGDDRGFAVVDDADREADLTAGEFALQYDVSDRGEGVELSLVASLIEAHGWTWDVTTEGGRTRLTIQGATTE